MYTIRWYWQPSTVTYIVTFVCNVPVIIYAVHWISHSLLFSNQFFSVISFLFVIPFCREQITANASGAGMMWTSSIFWNHSNFHSVYYMTTKTFSKMSIILLMAKCTKFQKTMYLNLLGGSSGAVNSLDFYPAPLKSLACFYFWWVLSSQWKAMTVNFTLPTLRHFWRPVVRMCLATSNNLLLVL